jgi:hypothetical protein
MNRPILVCALLMLASAALRAQEASPYDPYEGVSSPPADDRIEVTEAPRAKPPAARPYDAEPRQTYAEPGQTYAEPPQPYDRPEPTYKPSRPYVADPAYNLPEAGNGDEDEGFVRTAPRHKSATPPPPALTRRDRAYETDPDGDIVHPHPLHTGELLEGTTVRVKLLRRLSSAFAEKGEPFRTKVAADVVQNGKVMLPAGTEIDGRVAEVSKGKLGGHGTMRLRPETVILPDGSRYRFHAELTGAPGSKSRVKDEGEIRPGSRAKRDGVEYGGAVGTGLTAGVLMGGPVGAVAGGLIGAGVVTAHLMISHPQAVLETGTTLQFTLTERLSMIPARRGEEYSGPEGFRGERYPAEKSYPSAKSYPPAQSYSGSDSYADAGSYAAPKRNAPAPRSYSSSRAAPSKPASTGSDDEYWRP